MHAVGLTEQDKDPVYVQHGIHFRRCSFEADPIPFDSQSMDAVSCCQALEHFTHSHLPPVLEMMRVLVPGGLLELDVPDAVCFKNRSRLLRGKNITYDYKLHYLEETPIVYKGREYYPNRHNREFTRDELRLLFEHAGFVRVDVEFLKSRRVRTGADRLRSIATAARDAWPSWRKSLIGFGQKPHAAAAVQASV